MSDLQALMGKRAAAMSMLKESEAQLNEHLSSEPGIALLKGTSETADIVSSEGTAYRDHLKMLSEQALKRLQSLLMCLTVAVQNSEKSSDEVEQSLELFRKIESVLLRNLGDITNK